MALLCMYMILLFTHWIGDFVLQTHWQALNKSKNNIALLRHVTTYTSCLAVVSMWLLPFQSWFAFILANAVLHFVTDYITSRITSRLWAKQDWHNFFVVIGFDQLLHQLALAITIAYLLRF